MTQSRRRRGVDRQRRLHRASGLSTRFVLVALTASCVLVGCGGTGTCSGFALSLAVTTGGASSPVEAAHDFAAGADGARLPDDDWRETSRDAAGARMQSGRSTLHAVAGSDGTWFVDSGQGCD